jgi:hypothetical protein
MAIEKSLYAAPEGLDSLAEEPDLEIEIVDPEMVTLDDGSMEISLVPDEGIEEFVPFEANLAEYMDEGDLTALASELCDLIQQDTQSRSEWVEQLIEGFQVLGLRNEERTEPWQGACAVNSTILTEAVIRFQADTMSEVFPAAGPVRTKILGQETKEKLEAAARVKADMNYQLTENMVEYRPEHERLLFSLGLIGSCFKKVYYDPALGRQRAMFIPGEEVIVPYGDSVIELAERVTHVMRKTKHEISTLMDKGFYRDITLDEPTPYHSDIEQAKAEKLGFELSNDNRHTLYEVHVTMVLDEPQSAESDNNGQAKPYVVTIDRDTQEILAIRRNWKPSDPLMRKRQHLVHYCYVPGLGFYGLGLIHIVGGYAMAGTSLIRQLVDAGTLSNLPGGLKARGMRIKGDDTPIGPGEWRDVDVPSGPIRDNILPLPYKEPSQVLLALLDRITTEGRRLAAISDIDVSDMSANAPVGTTLALLERTLKPMTAVQSRVHYAMKQEFKLLKEIIAEHASETYDYQPDRGEVGARAADYAMVDVIPVSDPNSSTMAQRVVQYQAAFQMSQQAPQIYNLPELHRQMLHVLGIKNAEKIVPTPEDSTPQDPISENMAALTGKPMKAFIYQDHEAHLAVHMSMMQDPSVMAAIGQSPAAQQVVGALQAHIAEHIAFKYRKDIEAKLGVRLPPPGEELPEEIEVLLSQVMAEAAAQQAQANQQQAAQQEAQQKAQDPDVQMRMAEQQIKAQEVERKAKKDQLEAALKRREQQRKDQETQERLRLEQERVDLDKAKLLADMGRQ